MKSKVTKIITVVTITGTLFFNPFTFTQIVSPVFAQTAGLSQTDQSTVSSPTPISSDNDASVSVQPPQIILTPDVQGANNLPTPLLLPDSPFYFLKRWGEDIRTFITIDDYKKAQLQLQFARNRLAEAQAELLKNRTDLTDKMLADYKKDLNAVNKATQKLTEEGKEVTSLIDTIKDNEDKRLAILDKRLAKATDPNDKTRIENEIKDVRTNSQRNINRLVNALTSKYPNQSPYKTFAGQVTSVSNPNFTIQSGNKTLNFTTDSNTQYRQYNSKNSASFNDIVAGGYIHVTISKNQPGQNQANSSSNTLSLAKAVVVNVPLTMVKPLNGTVANFAQNSFTLNAESGAYTINVNHDTRWRSNRKDLDNPLAYIKSGVHVRVWAIPQTDSSYLARLIILLLPSRQVRNGVITSIRTNSITIQAGNDQNYTFNLTGQTIVTRGKSPASSTDLAVGEKVRVEFDGVEGFQNGDATQISIINNGDRSKGYQMQTNPFPSTNSSTPDSHL